MNTSQINAPQGFGQIEGVFKSRDGKAYLGLKCGAIVRIDKDRRSVKERKRARREARST